MKNQINRREWLKTTGMLTGAALAIPQVSNAQQGGKASDGRVMFQRSIPGCFITGQAAGIAAAMSVETEKSVHDINIRDLRRRLRIFGAYLPDV